LATVAIELQKRAKTNHEHIFLVLSYVEGLNMARTARSLIPHGVINRAEVFLSSTISPFVKGPKKPTVERINVPRQSSRIAIIFRP
jgi:hypothetical protein